MKEITLNEHIENADDMAIVLHYMNRIRERMRGKLPKSHPIRKRLDRFAPSNLNPMWVKLQSELDTLYHQLVTDQEVDVHGHVYYNLDDRFKELDRINRLRASVFHPELPF